MVLISATGFGTLAIFAKLGYASGLGTEQILAFRFLLAAIGMIVLALVLGQNPLRLRRNQLLTLFGLGAIVYTGQSLTYFVALRSLPASLVVLIAFIYPSLVVVAGWLFLRRAVSAWHGIALGMSFLGVALLVGGSCSGPVASSSCLPGRPGLWAAGGPLVAGGAPAVPVSLAGGVLGDRLSVVQVVGGILVSVAVIVGQAAHLWRPGLPNALK